MKTQKDIVMAWVKMELNSSYGPPPIPVIPIEYDEKKSQRITEEGKEILFLMMNHLKTNFDMENNTLINHDNQFLLGALSSELVTKAKNYAIKCHTETNHKYDGKPYEIHLQMVVDYACKYSYLIGENVLDVIIASAWVHDTIEDCRQTYNDVKTELDIQVAEITYALTNEKGRTRRERANSFYYDGIRNTPFAGYVKLCDRLANSKYSKQQSNGMIEVYRKEHMHFMAELCCIGFQPMWDELSELIS